MAENTIELKSFFRSLPASSRNARKEAYEHLLAVENGQIKGNKMPWMKETWQRGLNILTEVIDEMDATNHAQNVN